MATAVAHNLEAQIRDSCLTKRIRISEFFIDFDQLRSGFVSPTQFFRTLWKNLGLKFTQEQEDALMQKYDAKGNGRLNWKQFSDSIERRFDPNNLMTDPVHQKLEPKEFLGSMRTVRPLEGGDEEKLRTVLDKVSAFYDNRGINLRTCMADFDRHHVGVVTESQFYRSFPGPPDVTEGEMFLLVQKYKDPDRQGLVNYLNLHHDLQSVAGRNSLTPASLGSSAHGKLGTYLPAMDFTDPTLQMIFDKLRVAVFKNGIRTPEFFRDFDKLRSGIITENQFVCGLSLACGKEASLSRAEIQKIAEYYRTPDGRVEYKDFCDMMENAFNISELEKKPTQEPVRPPRGALSRVLQPLTNAEEAHLEQVLNCLAEDVRKRQLMMFPYFKDFDKSKAYTRNVTKDQFQRILHFLSLHVEPEDMKLLLRKFEEPISGYISYPAFVQAIDKEFVGFSMDTPEAELRTTEEAPPTRPVDTSNVDLSSLMTRFRHLVLTKRLRVLEHFQDFDALRSGAMTKTQFRRCLSSLGLSSLGEHKLTDAQFQVLCREYQHPKAQDKVCWMQFMWDLETVFTQPNLEKTPDYQVPSQDRFLIPKPGTVDWSNASEDHRALFDATMERLREKVAQRRIIVKPTFQDFDRHNRGLVTQGQFRQCLAILELPCTDAEMIALEAKFVNDHGFNYTSLLKELEPQGPLKHMYMERLKDLAETNARKAVPEFFPTHDVEGVLAKIKNKVVRERMRILEFMRDYDKLRSGSMLKITFRRAVDLANLHLTESEVAMIEDRFQTPGRPDFVDYLRFCEEVESVFTKQHLEKKPLEEPELYKPPVDWEQNVLSPQATEMLERCIERISDKVRQHRMQLFPLFEDYDRVHNGTVTKQQFRRTLTELELGNLVSEHEFEFLGRKFEVLIGGKLVMNYIAFCDLIYEICKFEWRKP